MTSGTPASSAAKPDRFLYAYRDVERISVPAAQAALAVSVAERARLEREIAVHGS